MWLDVGGLLAEPADAAQALLPALRALVTLPRGGLDVESGKIGSPTDAEQEDSTALRVCRLPIGDDGTRSCGRLCLGNSYHCGVCKEDAKLQGRARRHASITAKHAEECVSHAAEARASDDAIAVCDACGNDICEGCFGEPWEDHHVQTSTCASSSCGAAFCAACCVSGALGGCTSGFETCCANNWHGCGWCRDCAPEALIVCRGKTCDEAWCKQCCRLMDGDLFSCCNICGQNARLAGCFCEECAWGKRELLGCWSDDPNCQGVCRGCAFDASSSSAGRRDGIRFCTNWERCAVRNRAQPICRICLVHDDHFHVCAGDGCTHLGCDDCSYDWKWCETCGGRGVCADCVPRYFRTADAEQCNACAG
jgi:hypothetical protein